MSEINCNNCAVSDFKESLCHRCAEMKRLGRAEDIEGLLIKAFSEVDSPAKSDCIDRQAAIAVADSSDYVGLSVDDVKKVTDEVVKGLKQLPSAQPEPSQVARDIATIIENEQDMMVIERNAQQWIPCSERLPEETKDVLVCYDFKGNRSVLIGALYSDEKFYGYDDEYLTPEGRKYRKAVAWMPLPEPYKGEQE